MTQDNFFRKDRASRTARKENVIKQKPHKWLIVCEGSKTEPNYFNGLISFINSKLPPEFKLNVTIIGTGRNTVSLVNRAICLQEEIDKKTKEASIPYGQTFVVFDKDSFSDKDFNQAILLCQKNKYIACWSNQAIEFWFLLHFIYCDSHINREEYVKKLNEQFKNKKLKIKYQKNLTNIFNILYENGNILKAIKDSKKIHKECINKNITPAKSESCTTIYQIFDYIDKRNKVFDLPDVEKLLKNDNI